MRKGENVQGEGEGREVWKMLVSLDSRELSWLRKALDQVYIMVDIIVRLCKPNLLVLLSIYI